MDCGLKQSWWSPHGRAHGVPGGEAGGLLQHTVCQGVRLAAHGTTVG